MDKQTGFAGAVLDALTKRKPLGLRALRGQYVEKVGNRMVDRSERINFDRSKYIPGNGASHRLGRARP